MDTESPAVTETPDLVAIPDESEDTEERTRTRTRTRMMMMMRMYT